MATLDLNFGPTLPVSPTMNVLRRVFLAGKISGNLWREQLVRGSLAQPPMPGYACALNAVGNYEKLRYPVLERACLSLFDYVGPFRVGCERYPLVCPDHGGHCGCEPLRDCSCHMEAVSHGVFEDRLRSDVLVANQDAIRRADLVFAWIDDRTAYATLYELGYAAALGKEIWMTGPRAFPEFGLVYASARRLLFYEEHPAGETPRSAFIELLHQRLSNNGVTIDHALLSPIEARFWAAWEQARLQTQAQGECLTLLPQYSVLAGKYRVDFAYLYPAFPFMHDEALGGEWAPSCLHFKVAIELDGLEAHRTTDQIAYDRRRQRELEADGWRVIRFGGKEVYHNADACVQETRRIITGLLRG